VGDRLQPGVERGIAAEGGQGAVGVEQRDLDDILGVVAVVDQATDEVEQARLVARHQGGEGGVVAAAGALDQLQFAVGGVVQWQSPQGLSSARPLVCRRWAMVSRQEKKRSQFDNTILPNG
jgi:hypothetical protein